MSAETGKMALARYLALAGVASRRAAELLITAGRVTVNGEVTTALTTRVDPAEDEVSYEGKPLKLGTRRYLMMNKPPGYICSAQDAHAERLVGELLPPDLEGRVFSVGRLDQDSEGLLLFTDDGDLTNRLTHPRYGIEKIYLVAVAGSVTDGALWKLEQGIEDEGEMLKVLHAEVVMRTLDGAKLRLSIGEGRKREIRRLCRHLNWRVQRLQRVQLGPLLLGDLPLGETRPLTIGELRSLREAAGLPPLAAPGARPPPPRPTAFSPRTTKPPRPRGGPR